ncbi:glycosyltransferase family 4 protein, partial [bacterium]|nr:glycosyltransferase family 4 protein [bacterium]
ENGITGFLIEPGSVSHLVDKICVLLSNSTLRDELGKNARKRVLEEFDWNVNTNKIVDAYKTILI